MNAVVGKASMGRWDTEAHEVSSRARWLALLEVCVVFGVIMACLVAYKATAAFRWEVQHLGWSYVGMVIYIGIPAAVVGLQHSNWVRLGVSCADWRTNLDIGIKASIIRILPTFLGWWLVGWWKLDGNSLAGGTVEALLWLVALALMIRTLYRQKPVTSGRSNVVFTIVFLLLPIAVALALGRLSLIIISTVVWQFFLSGFGEEFVYRGYYQTRLNQVFGRPGRLWGISFGPGLLIAAFLFGLNHALNTYNPAVGWSSLAWGWALSTFAGGLFFGVLREKTGTLLAPGMAHGLLDGCGEPLIKLFF